jgi:hypothetical protein
MGGAPQRAQRRANPPAFTPGTRACAECPQCLLPFLVLGELRAGFVHGRLQADNERTLRRFLLKDGVHILFDRDDRRMLELLIVIGRALKRSIKLPAFQKRDRLFWIGLARHWRNWRTALVLVRTPWCDGIVTGSAGVGRGGRDHDRRVVCPSVRSLVREMATANRL